ncbi:hypothetical protein [Streptomyces sp. NPDC091268]|uniref:hypothetical protein n=1 Tax=Streptomyces sp. NPDC091268 TaxID=3365979 RepID=UPI0038010677
MSFDEEWSAARARAGTRASTAPSGPGSASASADLELDQDHIGAVGSEAYKLHARLSTDGRHAATATAEAANALSREHFASGPALLKVHSRWAAQLKTLVAACAHISNGLDYSLSSHDREERELAAAFTASKIETLLR